MYALIDISNQMLEDSAWLQNVVIWFHPDHGGSGSENGPPLADKLFDQHDA